MRTLSVFDMDETLFNSPGKVYVRHKVTKEVIREVDSSLTDDLKSDEEYDYSDFRSSKLFYERAKPIEKMVKRYRKMVKERTNHDHVCIITARADMDDKALFVEALKLHKCYFDDVHVHRAGNYEEDAPTTPLRKTFIINKLIYKSFDKKAPFERVRMFDDSYRNLQQFLILKTQWEGIEFDAFHVTHKGKVTRYKG